MKEEAFHFAMIYLNKHDHDLTIQQLTMVLTLCSPGQSITGLPLDIPLLVWCTTQGHRQHRPP